MQLTEDMTRTMNAKSQEIAAAIEIGSVLVGADRSHWDFGGRNVVVGFHGKSVVVDEIDGQGRKNVTIQLRSLFRYTVEAPAAVEPVKAAAAAVLDTEVRAEAVEVIAAAVEQHEAAAKQHEQDAADSFERSDTDGFVSQWASQTLAREERLAAEIARDGGRSEFPALFDLDGNLVAAKLVTFDDKFRGIGTITKWAILESDDPKSRATTWVTAFPVRASTMQRKGYYEGTVRADAKADLVGSGTGLAAAHTVRAVAVRTDGGFSRDVEIVDNGQPPAPVAVEPVEVDTTQHDVMYVNDNGGEHTHRVTGLAARDAYMSQIISDPALTLLGCKRVDDADRFTLTDAQIEQNAAESEALNLADAEQARSEREADAAGDVMVAVGGSHSIMVRVYRNMRECESRRAPVEAYECAVISDSGRTVALQENGWRLMGGWQTLAMGVRWVAVERREVVEQGPADAHREPRRMERTPRNLSISLDLRKPEDDAAVGEWLKLLTGAPDEVLQSASMAEVVATYRRGDVRAAVEALKGLLAGAESSRDAKRQHDQATAWGKAIDAHLSLCWRRGIAAMTREEAASRLRTIAHHEALSLHQDWRTLNECTHGGDCKVHPDNNGLHNRDADVSRDPVERATDRLHLLTVRRLAAGDYPRNSAGEHGFQAFGMAEADVISDLHVDALSMDAVFNAANPCTFTPQCRQHPGAHQPDARVDTGERTSDTCAYPNDTEGAHDHADCLDALHDAYVDSVLREGRKIQAVSERNADAVVSGERKTVRYPEGKTDWERGVGVTGATPEIMPERKPFPGMTWVE